MLHLLDVSLHLPREKIVACKGRPNRQAACDVQCKLTYNSLGEWQGYVCTIYILV